MNSKNWNSWEEREAAYRQERMERINREFAASKASTEGQCNPTAKAGGLWCEPRA